MIFKTIVSFQILIPSLWSRLIDYVSTQCLPLPLLISLGSQPPPLPYHITTPRSTNTITKLPEGEMTSQERKSSKRERQQSPLSNSRLFLSTEWTQASSVCPSDSRFQWTFSTDPPGTFGSGGLSGAYSKQLWPGKPVSDHASWTSRQCETIIAALGARVQLQSFRRVPLIAIPRANFEVSTSYRKLRPINSDLSYRDPQVHLNIPCHYYLGKLPLVILQLLCWDNIPGHEC